MSRRTEWLLMLMVLLAAAWLRIYRLDSVPPGWRDDEVVETTVHAALIQQGHWLLFFPQAEGHEPLYHYLSAAWLALAGTSLFSVRMLSAFLGLLSVAALQRLARRLFGGPVALVAAGALAVSFWGLMYSRFKLRQVGMAAPMLLAFYFVFRALGQRRRPGARRRDGLLAALYLTASLYTYYAARAIPVILIVFAAYLLVFQRDAMRGHWRALALAAAVTAALVVPLAVAIAFTGQSQARLSVVGAPLADLLRGDPRYALRNAAETLAMPAFTGDPEFLYNIPGRPLLEPLGASLFGLGLLLTAWRWRQPRYAFLLIWLVVGLAPAFVSTPSASLSHTIAAQAAIYLLPSIGVVEVGAALSRWARNLTPPAPLPHSTAFRGTRLPLRTAPGIMTLREGGSKAILGRAAMLIAPVTAVLFLVVLASRDLGDYFMRWPALPQVRQLYRADLHEAARALRQLPEHSELGLASATLHPADALALALDTPSLDLRPVVFTPGRAWPFPGGSVPVLLRGSVWPVGFSQAAPAGDFELRSSNLGALAQPAMATEASFQNGWQCYGYTLALKSDGSDPALELATYWRVEASYVPPAPRPVDVLAGAPLPLKLFSHLLRPDGSLLAGDDHLDVDPATLRGGDSFVQSFRIPVPPGLPPATYAVAVGIYDPASGVRVHLLARAGGGDSLSLTTLSLPQ